MSSYSTTMYYSNRNQDHLVEAAAKSDDADLDDDNDHGSECSALNARELDDSEEEMTMENIFEIESDTDLRIYQQRWSLGRCLDSRPFLLCLYLTLVFLLIAGVISLVTVAFLLVGPYQKAAGFLGSTCTAVFSTREPEERHCSCGQGCDSSYPCVKVHVVLPDSVSNATHVTVIYENEVMLGKQCTFYPPCKRSQRQNGQAVTQYELKYGVPRTVYDCFYNPDIHSEVIRSRRFHLYHVLHGTAWPLIICITTVIFLVLLCRRKGCNIL